MQEKKVVFFNPNVDSIESIITLGDSNSKTLGHLPKDAYKEYAQKKGIVVCKIKNELAGYCLFRRKQRTNIIKIAQLCVDPNFRGQSVADRILSFIKEEFNNHCKGISLNCRRDYKHASEVWKRNHFFPLEEKRSRSKKENYLLQWFYSFNQVNLFSETSSSKIKVLLDLNIVIKIRESSEGEEINDPEIKYLFNDDLLTEVEYFYANESLSEIIRDEDNSRRKETRKLLKNFKPLKFSAKKFVKVFKKVLNSCPAKNENDRSDRKQIAEAIVNNIPFFVTTDESLIKSCKPLEDEYNISILLPSEFIIQFDQIQNTDSFLPRRIGGATFDIKKLTSDYVDTAIHQFHNPKDEKKSDFKKKFHILCSDPGTAVKLVCQKNNDFALFSYNIENKALIVGVLRIRQSSIKYTLFNQIVTEIIQTAMHLGMEEIWIISSEIDSEMMNLLTSFRFFKQGEFFKKIILSGSFSSIPLLGNQKINRFFSNEFEGKQIGNEQKYELERVIFPGKIIDLDIQNLIIPIKPYWASQLFDNYLSSYSLFGANEKLIWNRKNVYYRSVNPNIEKSPARILWYVSSSKNGKYGDRAKGIVACSYLERTQVGLPKPLFRIYKKIGIYDWSNIFDLSKQNISNKIKVIEFSDTEVFKKTIPLRKIQGVLKKKQTFQSPIKITKDEFFELYSQKIDST